MNTAEYLVKKLEELGVNDFFGLPGDYNFNILYAVENNPNTNWIGCTNELNAGYAADGYARTSGKLGVYFTTSGPGAVNAFGGLADAWFDGIPIMGICGNVPTNEQKGYSGIRQNGFQEMDIVSMTKRITKLSVTPSDPGQFPEIVSFEFP